MEYEIDFLPVGEGSGDAITARYGDPRNGYRLHVVDGGRTETSRTIISHIDTYYPNQPIDHMVVTHADNDHACGLIGVIKNKVVKNLWMNRPWLYVNEVIHNFHGNYTLQGLVDEIRGRHSYLVELERLAVDQGTQIHDVFQGATIGSFTVLAPRRQRYIDSIPDFGKTPDRYSAEAMDGGGVGLDVDEKLMESWDHETLAKGTQTSASNESSVIQYANLDGKGFLLTGDVGPVGLEEAHAYLVELQLKRPTFVQVPHHGSRHNVTPSLLDAWLGPRQPPGVVIGTAFCSVGSNKNDYPRAQVTNAFMRRGFKVYATRTKWLSHSKGGGHPGKVAASPEVFSPEVRAIK